MQIFELLRLLSLYDSTLNRPNPGLDMEELRAKTDSQIRTMQAAFDSKKIEVLLLCMMKSGDYTNVQMVMTKMVNRLPGSPTD